MEIHAFVRTEETNKIMIALSVMFCRAKCSNQFQNKDSGLSNENSTISTLSSKMKTKLQKKHRPFLLENDTIFLRTNFDWFFSVHDPEPHIL